MKQTGLVITVVKYNRSLSVQSVEMMDGFQIFPSLLKKLTMTENIRFTRPLIYIYIYIYKRQIGKFLPLFFIVVEVLFWFPIIYLYIYILVVGRYRR